MANSISERVIEEKVLNGIDAQGVIELTQKLIQFQTMNPPADYLEIAPYLYELLTSLGMETHIMEGYPRKKNVFGIWRGSAKEGALLLNGHTDVVLREIPRCGTTSLFEPRFMMDGFGAGAVEHLWPALNNEDKFHIARL